MNRKHHILTGILLLLLGLTAAQMTQAQDISIESADPASAEQGTLGQAISIKGKGFDKSVREVRFLVHCDPADTSCVDDPGGITVTGFNVNSATEIAATIDVSGSARLSKFDVAVTTRGRGGKGTTYRSEGIFEVTLRPNQQLVLCDELLEDPLGTCTCQFSWEGNDNIYGLLDHCVTSETLKLKSTIRTAGSIQANGTERLSITAVPCGSDIKQDCTEVDPGKFSGTAVVENAYHRANIRYVDIRFGPGAYGNAPARGCENGEIHSAVSFVLGADTPDPKTSLPEAQPDTTFRNSLLYVHDLSISSDDDPLCNAVEVIRTPGYTAAYSDLSKSEPARDWKISVNNVEITAGSYLEAGIVMLGMMPLESINPPNVFNNTIGAAGCDPDHSVVPVGILFGDLTPDPENQIEGVVESNTIDMGGGCSGVQSMGVQVVSDMDGNGSETTVKVSKNAIAGADTGMYVDCAVEEAGFSGNSLTGIEDVTDDVGILSDALNTSTKGKPNKWRFYSPDDELIVDRADCQP